MISEKEISKQVNRVIKSPIRIGSLTDLGINSSAFLDNFSPFFKSLEDDLYAIREKQIGFLIKAFEKDTKEIKNLYKPYFEGRIDIASFQNWVDLLDSNQQNKFKELSLVTRQRNISSFILRSSSDGFEVSRHVETDFEQNVDDFRGWKRVFSQASAACVENDLFYDLLKKVADLVRSIHPEVRDLKITGHFMRTISYKEVPGENAPEGIHEDGSQYIVSALVIDRQNIAGAESQIYEKFNTPDKELIYAKVLAPGEFIFQADSGEEKTFGNDLWHYVTPIEPIDKSKVGTRDIIGFDIDALD